VSIFITEVEAEADGPKLAVKDIFDTAGVRTTSRSGRRPPSSGSSRRAPS